MVSDSTSKMRTIFFFSSLLVSMSCSSAAPSPVDYPSGPYGVEPNTTIANLKLTRTDGGGFELGTTYRGAARALVLYGTATWCFTCRQEVAWLNARLAQGSSVVAVAVVLEDERFGRPDVAAGTAFATAYGPSFLTVVDRDGQLDGFRGAGIVPVNVVIDTSTMRIVYRQDSFDADALGAAVASVTKGGNGS